MFSILTAIFVAITFYIIGFFTNVTASAFILFLLAIIFYGLSTIFFSMSLSTFFYDSKLSSQVGSLLQILPLAFWQLLVNDAEFSQTTKVKNFDHLYIGYPIPFVPMSVIISACLGIPKGELSLSVALFTLMLSTPLYFVIFVYLD